MIRNLIILTIVLFSSLRGDAQTDSVYNYKGKSMIRYFDIEEFKRKSTTNIGYDCIEGGMRVFYERIFNSKDKHIGYIERRVSIDTPYSYYYEYDLRGRLRLSLKSFYSFYIGKQCYYDTLGRVIETIDHDIPYKFTLDAFIEKMKNEYGYDALDKKIVTDVYRDEGKEDLHRPWYKVFCLEEANAFYGNRYLIDGTTGETLYVEQHIRVHGEGSEKQIEAILAGAPETIQDKYLYELKKKNERKDKKGTRKKGKSFWRKLFD